MDQVYQQMASAWGLVRTETLLCLVGSLFFLLAVVITVRGRTWGFISITALLAIVALDMMLPAGDAAGLASLFRADSFSHFIRGFSLLLGLALVALSIEKVPDGLGAEYYGCLFLVVAGLSLAGAANDLVTLFLALELVSIPSYILLYLLRVDARAQEATLKYFMLSLFSTALFLFGLSLLFGVTGSTNLEAIRAAIHYAQEPLFGPGLPAELLISLVMIVAALGFRLTAAPFHFYAPDVYQGAPTLVVTILATVPKVAGVVGLFQLASATLLDPSLGGTLTSLAPQAAGLFWILALVSMFIGNLMGLWQDDLKRLLAYSGVAHAGYLLVAVGASVQVGAEVDGLPALLFYLVTYTVMTLGSFAVVLCLESRERKIVLIDDLAGVGKSHPFLAFLMAVFMFSLTGLPPTVGFLAKLNLFLAAWSTGQVFYQSLAVAMAVNAAIGAWYYLRIVGVIYLRDAVHPLKPRRNPAAYLVAGLCGFLMLYAFVWPQGLYSWTEQAVRLPPPAAARR